MIETTTLQLTDGRATTINGGRLIRAVRAAGCEHCATPCQYAPVWALRGCRKGQMETRATRAADTEIDAAVAVERPRVGLITFGGG